MGTETLITGGTTEGTEGEQTAETTGTPGAQASGATKPSGTEAGAGTEGQEGGEGSKPDTTGKTDPPESYDLALPEGSKLGEAALETVTAYAKAHGLSQEAAAEALNLANTQIDGYVEAQQAKWQTQVHETWPAELKADTEFGGEHFEANADKARSVLEKFGPPGFKDQLNESGFGNHPGLLKWALNVAKAMGEDELETGGKGGGEESQAEKLFGRASRSDPVTTKR